MTVEFGSFSRSALGAFVQSPVGDRDALSNKFGWAAFRTSAAPHKMAVSDDGETWTTVDMNSPATCIPYWFFDNKVFGWTSGNLWKQNALNGSDWTIVLTDSVALGTAFSGTVIRRLSSGRYILTGYSSGGVVKIYASDDKGDTWFVVYSKASGSGYGAGNGVNFITVGSTIVIPITETNEDYVRMVYSEDGGNNWTESDRIESMAHGFYIVYWMLRDSSTGFLYMGGRSSHHATAYRRYGSVDLGKTWTHLGTITYPVPFNPPFRSTWQMPSGKHIADNRSEDTSYVYQTSNLGETWTAWPFVTLPRTALVRVGNTLYWTRATISSPTRNPIYRSTDELATEELVGYVLRPGTQVWTNSRGLAIRGMVFT